MNFLELLGILFIITALVSFIVVVWALIEPKIDDARRNYRYKHRFDKPPTADCYCVDCRYWKRMECEYMTYGVGDNCFCWRATPKENI